ncbi:ribonuclease H1 [Xylogone sp. PMI_703]|nr:ribonuclease H1 [Xylogone sp. PMI_703]
MVYIMRIYVDGGCRHNGSIFATGAAAAVLKRRNGKAWVWTTDLPSYPRPTNQRAEISAIVLALEQALDICYNLNSNQYLDVKIYSDSKYAVNCMNEWVYKWSANGWINSSGCEVANRDLIEEASDLDNRLKEEGSVKYIWIPRGENVDADRFCNEALNKQQ